MAQYNVTITNGSGKINLPAGKYTVTSNIPGYTGTLTPTTFTATTSAGSQDFTLSATGTLTLNANETGALGGTPIKGGTFIRCSQDGLETYGTEKTVNSSGICVFNNVPYGSTGSPQTFYIKQLTSDATHNIKTEVITINMENQTSDVYVQNNLIAEQQFTLADPNYSGNNLNGTLTFDGPTQS